MKKEHSIGFRYCVLSVSDGGYMDDFAAAIAAAERDAGGKGR